MIIYRVVDHYCGDNTASFFSSQIEAERYIDDIGYLPMTRYSIEPFEVNVYTGIDPISERT